MCLQVRILGTGSYAPGQCVPSTRLDQRWQKRPGWVQRRSGIARRHYAQPDETTSMMGARAARAAITAAGIGMADIDCIVSACSVMEQAIPCSAVFVQRALGLAASGIPAFDINATCLSFIAALDMLSLAIAAGRYHRVLIVSSEIATAGIPEDDPETAMLFGDGAGAIVLGGADSTPSHVKGTHFETYSEHAELCQVRSGGTRIRPQRDIQAFLDGACFEMRGRETYHAAARLLPRFVHRLLARAGIGFDALDWVVPHQASAQAMHHLKRLLQWPDDKLIDILADHGNQMAASIPVALDHAVRTARVRRGDQVMLLGSGAGLSFGGVVLKY